MDRKKVEIPLKDIIISNAELIKEQFDGEFCTIVRLAYQLSLNYSKNNQFIGATGIHELSIAVSKDIITYLHSQKSIDDDVYKKILEESSDIRHIDSILHNFEVLCPLRKKQDRRPVKLCCAC